MPILYENLSKHQVDLCSLILSSSGILFRLAREKGGYSVWVDDNMYHQALYGMQSYFKENREPPSIPDKRISMTEGDVISSIAAAMILLVCHIEINLFNMNDRMISLFGSSANNIMQGGLYRTVTSLMLHSDALHLTGNMVGIILFGTAVCAVCGWGVGWLMILMSGAIGNLINAFMYESGHVSIGASTAVFGAIGILSGYQLIHSRRSHQRRFATWAPLGCGLALLGLLGSEPHSDITAHFFGFAVGIGMGAFYAMAFDYSPKISYQIVSAILASLVILIAWFFGLRAAI